MNIQKGGFQRGGVLAVGNNTIREEVYTMLNTKPLNYIDTNSTYGVIFSLELDPADDETNPFLDLETNEKVHSFIIKLAVINEPMKHEEPKRETTEKDSLLQNDELNQEDETPTDDYRLYTVTEGSEQRSKCCSTIHELLYETNVQQYVWAKSFSGGREPLCPPVVDFIIINSNTINKVSNNIMLQQFYNKYVVQPSAVNRGRSFKLGLIIMPMVPNNPTTLLEWSNNRNYVNPDNPLIGNFTGEKLVVYSTVISQIMRLFYEIEVIHLDLHPQNILIYEINTPNGPIYKTKIIDFGIASIIANSNDDEYFDKSRKSTILQYIRDRLKELPKSLAKTGDPYKINFIDSTLYYLNELNTEVYNNIFMPQSDPNKIQLKQLTNIILSKYYRDYELNSIKYSGYDRFFNVMNRRNITNSSPHSMEELKIHMAEKRMYNYKLGNILNIEDEDIPVKRCSLGTSCTVMGGRRPRRSSLIRLSSHKTRSHKSRKNMKRKTKRRRAKC
jgi:hypothetical protein